MKLGAEFKLDVKNGDENKELKITAAGETDSEGLTTLNFQIPNDVKFPDDYYEAEIKVTPVKTILAKYRVYLSKKFCF